MLFAPIFGCGQNTVLPVGLAEEKEPTLDEYTGKRQYFYRQCGRNPERFKRKRTDIYRKHGAVRKGTVYSRQTLPAGNGKRQHCTPLPRSAAPFILVSNKM